MDGVGYVFPIVHVASQVSVNVNISQVVSIYMPVFMQGFVLHSDETTKGGMINGGPSAKGGTYTLRGHGVVAVLVKKSMAFERFSM
jgi:hypothetical protein